MRAKWWIGVVISASCSRTKPAGPPPAPNRTPGPAPNLAVLPTVPLEAGSGDIGTNGPTLPLGAGEDGAWTAVCQARADTDGVPGIAVTKGYHGDLGGDRMLPYFVRGGGPGIEVERVVAASKGGKYVAFIRGGRLVIFDSQAGTTSTLADADLRGLRSRGGPAALSFSRDGARAIYFRPVGERTAIVIRELATAIEREIVLGRGTPFVVVPDPVGPWARLQVVADDTDHDGKLTLPEVRSDLPDDACVGGAMSYSTFGTTGDRPTEMWLRLDTGEVLESANLIQPVTDGLLMRADDGAVMFGTETIVPASCGAVVKSVLEAPLRVIVICKGSERERPIEVFGTGFHFTTAATLNASIAEPLELLETPFECSAYNGCFDVRDGAVLDLHGATYRQRHEQTLILELGQGFALFETSRREYRPFEGTALQALAATQVVTGRKLIDLSTGAVVGTFSENPIVIDARGRALVASADKASSFPRGPLRWVSSTPR